MARLSAATLALGAIVLALAVCAAYAQPCIECKDCTTSNCWRQCKPSCPKGVNGDDCKRKGQQFGRDVARQACDTTRKFCNGGQKPLAAKAMSSNIGTVSKRQCANIAYGACQQVAMDRSKSPCGRDFNGFRQCNARQFMDFYTGEVNDLCLQKAMTINN